MSNLWQIDIYPSVGYPDPLGRGISTDAADLGLGKDLHVVTARGYLVQGPLNSPEAQRLATELFADHVVERTVVAYVGDGRLKEPPTGKAYQLVHVLPKPGVMDPVAQSAQNAIADFGLKAEAVRTFRKYWIAG